MVVSAASVPAQYFSLIISIYRGYLIDYYGYIDIIYVGMDKEYLQFILKQSTSLNTALKYLPY